jgi:photosystem II stability/assembly factor-like uncharacterized protein
VPRLTRPITAALVVLAALAPAGCGTAADSSATAPRANATAPRANATAPGASATATAAAARLPADAGHIHGLTVDASGTVVLGTHEGAYTVTSGGVQRLTGVTVDLMGFAAAGAGRLVASGHPGPGADLPSPLGLAESRDGGRTWRSLSRGGESDFHALAVAGTSVYGFDGTLRVSTDGGRTWADRGPVVEPAALAANPAEPGTVLATTASGVQRSTDAGRTFAVVGGGLVLQAVAWPAPGAVFGVEPSGRVHASTDGGISWQARGRLPGQPHAVGAADARTVAVATEDAVLLSTDGGATFRTLATAG